MRRLSPLLVLLALAVPLALAPAAVGKKHKPKNHVTIKEKSGVYRFSPKTITVKHGKTVTWAWKSDSEHNVTFDDGRHSKTATKVKSYKLKFATAGTFAYTCTVHGFTGKVVVK